MFDDDDDKPSVLTPDERHRVCELWDRESRMVLTLAEMRELREFERRMRESDGR